MNFELFISGLVQGSILALLAYAVMIPFRLLNLPDLSSEGAYPLGGAVCATLLIMNIPPFFSVILSCFIAGIMGIFVSILYLRLKVNSILAGIILSTMVYSINLRMMGKSNIALFSQGTLFGHSAEHQMYNLCILLLILMIVLFTLILFLRTDVGLRFRAVGLNTNFARRQGIKVSKYIAFGLFFSSCLSGLAGSLVAQLQQYVDVGMGVGIVIHALASLMLGEVLLGNDSLSKQILSPFLGAMIYQQIQGIALSVGLTASDLKFFTGGLVLLVIILKRKEL